MNRDREPTSARVQSLDGPLARALRPFIRTTVHEGAATGPLAGWTVALKDNIDVEGDLVEVGSPALRGRRAPATATVARRLLEAGATLAGRTRVVELCWGSWGLNEHCGMARNPWDAAVERVPGGSSAGSAVAVAARLVRAALGSDTAGSIRMPAALCGISGFKPSLEAVPSDGLVPLATSYDSVGPMALDAADCAALYAVMAGVPVPGPAVSGRIAVLPQAAWPVPVEPAVAQALQRAASDFAALGFDTVHAGMTLDLGALTAQAGILIAAESWSQLGEHFLARPGDFGAAIRRRLEAARAQSAAQVAAARDDRARARQTFDAWLQGVDALLLPTVPRTAPAAQGIDESGSTLGHFTRWVNHVGGCAISLPAGLDAQGMPVALQLVGPAGADASVLALAQAFQAATPWHLQAPALAGFIR